ncbi:hypothetical protein DS745_23400 [Anaerobacillus alkaliphilus]|uniref:Uncharacterized protein n=1 Tax=Anaerobacillus alkaliphilus TaxID=1548597 RepID=A0A4Q0VMW4_9BACI|nr:hypothetical protein [Anaerobacillus alkaliphilus]RXI96648.1 hypothetical protein DS745_23400 [Anaerobacillus alkaliphilus]
MKRSMILAGIAMTISVLSACTNEQVDVKALTADYESKIEAKNNEITKLHEELSVIKVELEQEKAKVENVSVQLQHFDHKARRIMNLIAENNFDEFKNEFHVDFEVIDELVSFVNISEYLSVPSLPIEIAEFPMYMAFYNPQPEFTEVGYFLYDNELERKYDIHFHFDKDRKFKFVTTN